MLVLAALEPFKYTEDKRKIENRHFVKNWRKIKMKRYSKKQIFLRIVSSFMIMSLFANWQMNESATAQGLGNDLLYTTDADFDQGTLVSVNHDAPYNDQLQLDSQTKPFPFINVAASGRGTVVRANTETGEIVGEYLTAPDGRGLNPSRTTVDLFGNVWTANREEAGLIDGIPHGSAVKIGLIVGGLRVDATGSPDTEGGYLAPPYGYNTCVDRNGDGLIRTSKGLGDILTWPDLTDGLGGTDGLVQDAEDECIIIYQRLSNAEGARHVSVDADNNVWVGGYPYLLRMFYKLDGTNGAILDSFDARDIGCGGYGGLIDGNGILWSVGGALLRYDPIARSGFCIQQYGYGLGIDTNGYIWMSLWDGGIVKVAPDGTVVFGFPKPTYPPSMMTSSLSAPDTSPMMAVASSIPALPEDASVTFQSAPGDEQAQSLLQNEVEAAAFTPLAEDPSVTFQVAPVDDWVQASSSWTPGATITLTIEDGGVVVYSDSQTADSGGYFNFNLWDKFDLQRGQLVTVSDGTTTKTHTVVNLFVDGVDMTVDTVFGRAEAGASVDVWVHGDGNLTVMADSSGNWTADFSGLGDLNYLSDGGSQQRDGDGDSTGVWWSSPQIQVAPVDHWVQPSRPWTPGTTITLTVEDSGVAVYSESQVANTDGNFNFNLWNKFDLQRGQVVTVSDGTITKTHTVTNLFVDGVDITADNVFGRADAGTSVEVWVHGDGNLNVTVDGSGNWTADFSSMTDLTYLSDGGSRQVDSDGDSTGVWWSSPRIQVSPEDDWVEAWRPWTPGTTITLTIEDGGAIMYTDSQTADANGYFNFNLWDVFDIQRGQVVTVSDGTTTKTHTVMDLFVDGVNVAADTIFGRADAGTSVEVWVHGDGNLNVTADGSGNWTADFSGLTDLTLLSDGGSRQYDSDGDATGVWWDSPRFQVSPDDNWVQSWNRWTPGTTISLTIEDGGTVVYSDSQTTDSRGNFHFSLWDVFDLQRGQVVTVSDGTITKTHSVINLYVDGVDVAADTISGRAGAGTAVDVWVNNYGNLTVTADSSGNWAADFSGMTDIDYLSEGGAEQADADGDGTWVPWATPRFQVAPEDDWVQSWSRWTPGATITLTIEDGGVVVYSDSQTADTNGNFNFNLWDRFDLQRGQVVTVSDGMTTKTHTVIDYYVDGVNIAADTIFGRAEAGTSVDVWVHGNGNLTTTVDGSGNWTADFSGMTDLTYLSDGGSQQFDSDGDATGVWWASPGLQVSPDDNWVQSWNRWASGTIISLTIEDGGTEVYSASQTADAHGNFNFDVSVLDLQVGQKVTVSDGTTTKTHTVIDVNVTDIDTDTDQIHGTANPGARVWVWVNLFDNGSGRSAIADPSGDWMVDFSVAGDGQPIYDITSITRVGINEFDDDGDSSYRQFGPPVQQNRGVAVTAVDNHVWMASSAYGTVTRLDNDGNILKVIDVGLEPTGVAIDAAGNVWVTNMSSHNAVRIDPSAGSDGLGAIDLTVDLGPDAWPYNYSDMTGTVVVGSTSPQGFWTVVQDGETPGFQWGRIIWNTEPEGNEPPGTAIVVEARASDTEAGLGGQTFQPIVNGELFSTSGRFIEVRVTLKASSGGVSPILSDIRILSTSLLPTVSSGGPYTVNEGSAVMLTASGSDPEGEVLAYEWDLDNNGSFETPGQSVTFLATGLDGPSSQTVSVRVTDSGNLSATDQTTVDVLNVAPTVAAISAPIVPVQVNTSVNTSANFTDPGTPDTHTAVWDWGDSSTSPGAVIESNGSGSVTGGHIYTTLGVYTVLLTVTDDDGGFDNEALQYIVVYDPNGGFVTGGGWINSPAGAYIPDPSLTGKATFGFVSKYQKGANVPTGNTEFQFHVANMNFKSTSYDWLVIAGTKAQYKGTGTINGAGEYKFMLTAIDGSPDKFRIKIWDKATGEVIYDNQLGESDNADPTTALQGGSIVIHKAK
jgi:sRNA-binding protein